jgi:ATP-dependent DNA helicase RecG
MEPSELLEIIARGEDGRNQFKIDVRNAPGLATEMAAFANSDGGRIFIGVSDLNKVEGLDSASVRRINSLISAAGTDHVKPAINPTTENVAIGGNVVIVISVAQGLMRPYFDNAGVVWVKSGSDKRKVTAREELQRMFQAAGLIHADERPVVGMTVADIDTDFFRQFYSKRFMVDFDEERQSLPAVLRNMNLLEGDALNVAGALLFGSGSLPHLPAFRIRAISYPGTEISDSDYLDSRDITGRISDCFSRTIDFVTSRLVRRQGEQGFNSIGEPEIPITVFEELIANALIHRDYFISAPIRLLMFRDRIEIVSPGHLPNHLTIENIKAGNSNLRNPILGSYGLWVLPYAGVGSGIVRALRAWPDIDFVDDRDGNLFKAIVRRKVGA